MLNNGKLYEVIYADPPWRYEDCKTASRRIENHYPTMEPADLCALTPPAAEDCILFLWSTAPKLDEALALMTAWGFQYRTCLVWDKQLIGMGYYWRVQHELLLLGRRGTPGTPDEKKRYPSVFRWQREEHSKKPSGIYTMIENMYPAANKLELFARERREGWDVWGLEAPTSTQKLLTSYVRSSRSC